jgi:hypothetical protein
MVDLGFLLGGAVIAGVVSAALAWLLQRIMPRMHPAVTALISVGLLLVIVVIVIGVLFVRTLIAIGSAGHASIDDQAPVVSVVILGVPAVMLLMVIGFPAALVAAFRRRASLSGRDGAP